jgi:lipopolysaccharide transport system ATP-binding protein
MVAANLLEVDMLSKRFCRNTNRSIRYGLSDILRELSPRNSGEVQLRPGEFWAVRDVSFTIKGGEAVAIVGRNGAGKTTLMRLLAGLLKPDCGEITSFGAINPVIELGQGLNAILNGHENAELGLAWRNVPKTKIAGLVKEIREFSELGDKFEAPVHTYSSGMKVRLSFAIAALIPSDILLLDEVLAVGDIAFQRKCLRHMQSHLDKGGSLIFVSHNVFQVQTVCRRGILIERGKIEYDGPIEECIDKLLDLQDEPANLQSGDRTADGQASIKKLIITAHDSSGIVRTGSGLDIEMQMQIDEAVDAVPAITIWSRDLSVCISTLFAPEPAHIQAGLFIKKCTLPNLPLIQGRYAVRAVLMDPETYHPIAYLGYNEPPMELVVESHLSRASLLNRNNKQLIVIEHEWADEPNLPLIERKGEANEAHSY